MNNNSVALIIAKKNSSRMGNKNWLDFGNEFYGKKPMFQWNLEKCLRIFKKVYVSSDYDFILEKASQLGAIPINRPAILCGDAPSIPVFRHALSEMAIKPDIIVSVQANSPTINERLIEEAKKLMETGKYNELMTCHKDSTIYGSIWALTADKLLDYSDPFKQTPEILLVDDSIDIHTEEDFTKATGQIIKIN